MRTLFLNPPSFEGFDGGASSRWPASREIESYWYPGLALLPGRHAARQQSGGCAAAQDLHRADRGDGQGFRAAGALHLHSRLSRGRADGGDDEGRRTPSSRWPSSARPSPSSRRRPCSEPRPSISWCAASSITRSPITPRASRSTSSPASASARTATSSTTPKAPAIENLDALPWVTKVYKRDLDITRYNVPFLLNPFISFYTSRGCPALCTFCLWPQTHSGHRWRLRSADDVANEVRYALEPSPTSRKSSSTTTPSTTARSAPSSFARKLKPLNFTWSCTSRVTTDYDTLKAMKEAGCRLLIVGYESGDPQILKNIKKGATVEMAERFTANCKKLGLMVHGDYIIGPARRNPREHPQDHRFRQAAGYGNHPGFHRPPLSRHRVLRLRQAERPHHHRFHDR